jgi:hypothetical protein
MSNKSAKSMKKQLSLLMTLIIVYTAHGQSAEKRKLQLGIMMNPSLGWVVTETNQISSGGVKAGIGLGIMGDYFFADNYALSAEFLHSTQGFKVKANKISYTQPADNTATNKVDDVTINYTIRSFQIPVSLKLRTNEIGHWRYYGQVGLAPSFAYRAIRADFSKEVFPDSDDNKKRAVNDKSNDFDYNRDGGTQIPGNELKNHLEEDNIRGFRLPVLIGAGAEWNLSGNTSVIMGIRYEYGLINMMKASDAIGRRNVVSLSTGIRF